MTCRVAALLAAEAVARALARGRPRAARLAAQAAYRRQVEQSRGRRAGACGRADVIGVLRRPALNTMLTNVIF